MIWGKWVDPNFEFAATDDEGHDYEFFCHAQSEDELKARLEQKLLTVHWIRPYDFEKWRERAKRATSKAIQDYNAGKRPINFNDQLWGELKFHLFELFHGKC